MIRARAARLRALTRYRHLYHRSNSGQVRVGYIGWTGEGNIGDEAMFWCQKMALGPNVALLPIPVVGGNFVLEKIAKSRLDALCLGGGTLIGNGFFGDALEAVLQAEPEVPRFMLGTGCESDLYTEGNRKNVDAELVRWRSLLEGFPEVRVRGPLSRETLLRYDVVAEVTGDPALLLPCSPSSSSRPMVVGLNVGVSEDSYGAVGSDPGSLLVEMVAILREAGLPLLLLPTTCDDQKICEQFMRTTTDRNVFCHTRLLDFHEYSVAVAECDFLIGMKLHSLIISASQGVPAIALEYRPKCRDFMATIGLGNRCMRLDKFDKATLMLWIDEFQRDGNRLRTQLKNAVGDQQRSLSTATLRERERLGELRGVVTK